MTTPTQDRPRCIAISTSTGRRCKRHDLARLHFTAVVKAGDPTGDLCTVHWQIDKAKKMAKK